jgi:hypothetical protein
MVVSAICGFPQATRNACTQLPSHLLLPPYLPRMMLPSGTGWAVLTRCP